jgi:hypothetical protein
MLTKSEIACSIGWISELHVQRDGGEGGGDRIWLRVILQPAIQECFK